MIVILMIAVLGYFGYQYWQKSQTIETFATQFDTAVSSMNIEALNALQSTYINSEYKADFDSIVIAQKKNMMDQFDAKLSSDQYREAISWISTIQHWYGEEGLSLVAPIVEDFLVQSLSAYAEIDMVSLTDTNREAFFKQANEKLSALTSQTEIIEMLNIPSLMTNVVEKWKKGIDSYQAFLNYSNVAYHIKAYRLEALEKYMLADVEVKPFESQLDVDNVDGVLHLKVPEDEKIYVMTLDEVKNTPNIGSYLIEENVYKEDSIDLSDKDIFYIIATNLSFQPAEDIQVFYGELDFSQYIYMDEAYQNIKTIALEELEKYRGLIEPLLISGYVYHYEDDKMVVDLNYLDSMIDYDLEPFTMNIVSAIDHRKSDSFYTSGLATGYSQIDLVYDEDRERFSEVFHHEMMHVIEAFETMVRYSSKETYAEMEKEYDRIIQNKKDLFELLRGKYLEDLSLSESEILTELDRILNVENPLSYGVLTGYSLLSRDEDTAEIWAAMTTNPALIEEALESDEIFKIKIDYTLDVMNHVKSLNGDKTKYDIESVKNLF